MVLWDLPWYNPGFIDINFGEKWIVFTPQIELIGGIHLIVKSGINRLYSGKKVLL
jgi:hypothetical protein